MYITSGIAKNRKILVPEIAKPVKSIVLNSIFSTLGEDIKNKKCLDLFAGSGALGLEALSRGASFCKFVDDDYDAISCLRTNVSNAKLSNSSEVERTDAVKYVENTNDKYDLIFLDPPYNSPITHILKNIYSVANKNCIIIYLCANAKNESGEDKPINNFTQVKAKNFGKTSIKYLVLDK